MDRNPLHTPGRPRRVRGGGGAAHRGGDPLSEFGPEGDVRRDGEEKVGVLVKPEKVQPTNPSESWMAPVLNFLLDREDYEPGATASGFRQNGSAGTYHDQPLARPRCVLGTRNSGKCIRYPSIATI